MRERRNKCGCGCGQAPGESCRQRLLECYGCNVKVRMTRQSLALVTLSCSCGGTFVAVCLEDRARAGDTDAAARLSGMVRLADVTDHGSPRNVGARWWCASCSAFVSGEGSSCGKCRHTGPHHYGEDAPTTGNADRRKRLKAAQRKRKAYRPAPRKVAHDLPF